MGGRRFSTAAIALAILLASAPPAHAGHGDAAVEARAMTEAVAAGDAEYALANTCMSLQPQSTSLAVASAGRGRYRAAAIMPRQAERFRMQATDLGSYLMLGSEGRFLGSTKRGVEPTREPSAAADWQVDYTGEGFTLTSRAAGRSLALDREGRLVLVDPADADRFDFTAAKRCLDFPEAKLNLVGKPQTGPTTYNEVTGLADLHTHIMAFEAFGGNLHCGRPWSPMGIEVALSDCSYHHPNGALATTENVASYGTPVATHDPVGWPTFKDWPDNESYTHENTYYRWIERTYRAGMRLMVMLAVDNSALCFVNPFAEYSCDEMLAVRREIKDTYALQDYIDAQYGGPGRGWFRIVRTPFQARRVINEGKLAVVLGIEVSEPLGCGIRNEVPQCDREDIDRGLDEFHAMGVRQMEMVNKFDNALAGVTFDNGTQGIIVNLGNRQATGRFWSMEPCTGRPYDNQPTNITVGGAAEAAIRALVPQGPLPVYPPGPNCNPRGLTDLGEYFLKGMIERKMLFDPDHMSVRAREQALHQIDGADYSGVVSSHSWSDNPSYKRIYKLGGFVAPAKSTADRFVEIWRERRRLHRESNSRYDFALGFSDDMNGFSSQPGPRDDAAENPLTYPFRSPIDPGVKVDRQVSGERVFDLNDDGLDHFGLYADWVADIEMIGGQKVIDDMAAGAEYYLQTWERAVGVPGPDCVKRRSEITAGGLRKIGMKLNPFKLLRRAGQPEGRPERSYRYCVDGEGNRKAGVAAAFTSGSHARVGLIASDASTHRIGAVRPGGPSSRVPARAERLGPGLLVEKAGTKARRFVYGVERGRVSFVAVASRAVARSGSSVEPYLRIAGIG